MSQTPALSGHFGSRLPAFCSRPQPPTRPPRPGSAPTPGRRPGPPRSAPRLGSARLLAAAVGAALPACGRMTWPGGAEVASQVGVGGGARAGSAAGPAACAGTPRPEMAAPGLQLCAAAALLLLLCLPLRARADEHEHTVRRVLASPGGARAAAPASPPPGPAAAEGRRRPQRPGERGRAGSDGPRPEGGGGGRRRSPFPSRGFLLIFAAARVVLGVRAGLLRDRGPFSPVGCERDARGRAARVVCSGRDLPALAVSVAAVWPGAVALS